MEMINLLIPTKNIKHNTPGLVLENSPIADSYISENETSLGVEIQKESNYKSISIPPHIAKTRKGPPFQKY